MEGLRVDDDLDDKVLLDLSVLQPRLVREQLPGEEPALVDGVDVFLGLQLLLQLPYGVGHAGAEAQVLARGEPYLQGTGSGEINSGEKKTQVKCVIVAGREMAEADVRCQKFVLTTQEKKIFKIQ